MWQIVSYFTVLMVVAMRTHQPEFVIPLALIAAALITWLEQLDDNNDAVRHTSGSTGPISHSGPGLLYDTYHNRDNTTG